MSRLSERLVSLGYYDEKEKPRVSYKEKLIKIFHKKRWSHQLGSPMSDQGTPVTPVVDTNGWRTPVSFSTSNTTISDCPTSSEILDTSIGDGRDNPTHFELPATPVVDETGDQPGNPVTQSSEGTEILAYDNNNEQTSLKCNVSSLLRNIGVILVILLCFAVSFNRSGSFYQTNALKAICWGPGCSESKSLRIVNDKLKQVQEELDYLRNRLLPKGLSMPNFALESQGARVVRAHPSETYHSPTQPPLMMFLGVSLWYPENSPRTVIQGHTESLVPGHCWAFAGKKGYLFISLSQPVSISHVTVGHISKEHAPPGFMRSAPQHFSVCGFLSEDGEGINLGTFLYDPEGESFQTFELPGPRQTVRYVMFEILTNWGHPEYTCLYSFKVHGGGN